MPALQGFSARSIVYHPGAHGVPEGPSVSFELGIEGARLTREELVVLSSVAPRLWAGTPFPFSDGQWFRKACHNGDPGDLGSWAAALIVAFQWMARDPVCGSRIQGLRGDQALIMLHYSRQPVFHGSLQWALKFLMQWLGSPRDDGKLRVLHSEFSQWLALVQGGGLMQPSFRIAMLARRLGVPVHWAGQSFATLGWGAAQRCVEGTYSHATPAVGARLAKDKFLTKQALAQVGVPVPEGLLAFDPAQAEEAARQLGWPLVVKPFDQDRGQGVVPGIRDLPFFQRTVLAVLKLSPNGILIERHVEGDDHRLLVVRGRMLVATRRTRAIVCGDGRRTIDELLTELNADPRRGSGPDALLIRVEIDEGALECLHEQGFDLASVPPVGRLVHFRRISNICVGGTPDDRTDLVHPDNRIAAERAARVLGLDIAGVDMLCPDLSRSWREVGGAICEVNSQPELGLHWTSTPGRDLDLEMFAALHEGHEFRVPVIALFSGATSPAAARLLQGLWRASGKRTGLSLSQGQWMDGEWLGSAKLGGEEGGLLLLKLPELEAAVVELSLQGLRDHGHPCDRYDVLSLLALRPGSGSGRMQYEGGIPSANPRLSLVTELLERAHGSVLVDASDQELLALCERKPGLRIVGVTPRPGDPAIQAAFVSGFEVVYPEKQDNSLWLIHARGTERRRLLCLDELSSSTAANAQAAFMSAIQAAALACAADLHPDLMGANLTAGAVQAALG